MRVEKLRQADAIFTEELARVGLLAQDEAHHYFDAYIGAHKKPCTPYVLIAFLRP